VIKYLVFAYTFLCLILCIFMFVTSYLYFLFRIFKTLFTPSNVCVAIVLDPTVLSKELDVHGSPRYPQPFSVSSFQLAVENYSKTSTLVAHILQFAL